MTEQQQPCYNLFAFLRVSVCVRVCMQSEVAWWVRGLVHVISLSVYNFYLTHSSLSKYGLTLFE